MFPARLKPGKDFQYLLLFFVPLLVFLFPFSPFFLYDYQRAFQACMISTAGAYHGVDHGEL